MKVYLIPGLGADRRMYANQLAVLGNAEVLEHLPAQKGETLHDYAKRFVPRIDSTAPFALVGTSLGGIISVELSRLVKPEKVIVIASIKNRSEMPAFIRAMRYLRLHRALSGNGFKRFNKLAARRLVNRGDKMAASAFIEMLNDTPAEFIEWAMDAVIHWKPTEEVSNTNIYHIHGTSDFLFPYAKVKNAIAIENGSHVMNMTKSKEVNRVLLEILYSTP
jgi:pimeloyl-ACP methyl ester carboxylesterase